MERVVIIIGATGGLGSEIARRFGTAGAKVVVSDISLQAAEKLSEEINSSQGQSIAYKADVLNYEELKNMVELTVKKWQKVDVLLNAAGGTLAMLTKQNNKLLWEHSEREWDLVVNINLKGVFNCIKAVAPQMIKQRDGHIILIASGSGLRPGKLISSYAAAKAGVIGLMKAAARELGEYNIKVNGVNPGLITHRSMFMGGTIPDEYIAETMLGRLSTAEDLASFMVNLSQTTSTSGQIFNLDSRSF